MTSPRPGERGLDPASLRGAVDLSALVRKAQRPVQPTAPQPGAGGAGAADGSEPDPAAAATAAPDAVAGIPVVVEADDRVFPRLIELSSRVPVIVEFYTAGIEPALGPIVEGYGGRLVLATVDGSANPQLAQAFQVTQVPAVAAVVGGRPLQLFVGIPAEDDVRQVLDQVLELAAQNGVTGSVTPSAAPGASESGDQPGEAPEPPLPPLHQEAFDAISRGDYAAAMQAYRTAIAQDPRDADAVAGLAQASLLHRIDGADASAVRSAAADAPADVDAQLAVADLDLAGGHVDDAFDRLLGVFPQAAPAERDRIRTRLLDYFEIAGGDDPRTGAARRRLTALLY